VRCYGLGLLLNDGGGLIVTFRLLTDRNRSQCSCSVAVLALQYLNPRARGQCGRALPYNASKGRAVDDPRYQRYLTWRTEALRRCRAVIEPPIAPLLPAIIDVAAIRERLGQMFFGRACTQQEFADRFGFSLATVQDWEHERRKPDYAARLLLMVIAHDPLAVDAAIQAAIARTAMERERVEAVEHEVVRPSTAPFEVVRIERTLKRKQRGGVTA